jgi:hypothetical protein
LSSAGNSISSLAFSIDYDASWLTYNSVSWNLPGKFSRSTSHNPADTDGEIDLAAYPALGFSPSAMADGVVATLNFTVKNPGGLFIARIVSSSNPLASFGSLSGTSLYGSFPGTSVWISTLKSIFMPLLRR